MDATSVAASADTSCTATLIVSNDLPLVEELRRILQEESQGSVQAVFSFREAEQLLERWRPAGVLIDFRRSAAGETPVTLLQQLSKRGGGRIPVVAISDAGYVCDWAVMADLVVSGHVQLPADRQQLARLVASQLSNGRGSTWMGPLTPRIVRGKTLTYKTYTPEMFPLLDDLATLAGHGDVTVLLVGETGTGKTTLARLIHELSPRHDSGLMTVACGNLSPELIESELFGHVKGAFTTAEHTRQGKLEAAKNGTLLLDEIDVLGPAQQAKLLRVIETGEFEPVGSNDVRLLKARLVVASNVDLKGLMEQNTFRADLYYRLSMLEMRIPPLRERLRDIVPLTLDFVEEFCTAHNVLIRRIHPDFLACLKRYHWPGNVRELKNHVRRAVLFCRSGVLSPGELAPHFRRLLEEPPRPTEDTESLGPPSAPPQTLVEKLACSEREVLERALREHNYNRTATAQALGLSRVGLYKKMKRHGLTQRRPR